MIAYRKLAPAPTEGASTTLGAIDIGNFPSLSLWIPECQLLLGVGKMLPDKFTWNNLQYEEVIQEDDDLQYNGTSSLLVRTPILEQVLVYFYTIHLQLVDADYKSEK
jgi:hypothetical protein